MRAPGRYRATRLHPESAGLELSLHHASGWPVLSITGSPQTLELTLANRMPLPVSTTALAELTLQFRPGILAGLDAIALAPQSDAGWSLMLLPADARGNLTLRLQVVEAFTLAPGDAAAIRIDGVSADPAGGSRATRVQAHYQGFVLDAGGAEVAGSRLLQLPVLRRHAPTGIAATALRSDASARAGPFLAGLLDGPDLLNDGTSENTLWLRIVNASGRPFELRADDDAATRFTLSFTTGTVDAAWGLRGTTADHVGLAVPSGLALQTAWAQRAEATGPTALAQPPQSPLQTAWQVDNHTLRCIEPRVWKPREWLDIVLTVYTSARTGDAQLVVGFENLPPYDDGDLVLLAHPGPLAARPEAVTVAVPMRLRQRLDIDGDLMLHGALRIAGNTMHLTPAGFKLGGQRGSYYPVVFEDRGWADGEFRLEVFRADTHADQPPGDTAWRGSMMLRIACHGDNYGHGSGYWSLALDQSVQRFVAGYESYPYAPQHVLWLAGDTSYRWLANHDSGIVGLDALLTAPGPVGIGRPGAPEYRLYRVLDKPDPAYDATHVALSCGLVNERAFDTAPVPRGAILMWSGNSTNVPSGWALCDGDNGTPDLRGRFIVGAGSGRYRNDGKDGETFDFPDPPAQPGDPRRARQTGGSQRVALAPSEMPRHRHAGRTDPTPAATAAVPSPLSTTRGGLGIPLVQMVQTPFIAPHDHPFQTADSGGTDAHENLPPYYTLCYIMRL